MANTVTQCVLTKLPSITRLTPKMDTTALNLIETTKSIDRTVLPNNSTNAFYTIEIITKDDSQEVLAMLRNFFFKDEPLNKFLELGDCQELEEYSLKCIKDGCSFKAVTPSGEIIGVFLNAILRRPTSKDSSEYCFSDCEHEKFRKIMQLMDYIDENFNIFDLYPDKDVVLDGKIVSVNSNYRGLGIAGRLTEHTLQYMKDNQISLMQVLCSSHFSARVMEKIGFSEVYRLNYCDYKVNDKIVFAPAMPHTSARILVKEI